MSHPHDMATGYTEAPRHPQIIQGGMGVGVSTWALARAVALRGQLGVVSGTAIDTVLVRRLQDGDAGGHMRRALAHFPLAGVADRVVSRYYLAAGRRPGAPYVALPMHRQRVTRARRELTVLASFAEVWLAKEGHANPVGLNLLTKVQLPNLATLYGAMLAGVDYVLMGAGIPREIPAVLDAFAEHQPAAIRLDVEETTPPGPPELITFDPREHGSPPSPLRRPWFFPIVSASSLAATLARKATGRVDGFIVEGPTAGGHNAPPRGELRLTPDGEPLYGDRDIVDLEKMRELGLPFWLAGGTGSPDGMQGALDAGASGVQVGTLFAYCEESGITPALKRRVLEAVRSGTARVYTDPRASPTGYPFKVVHLAGAEGDAADRERVCDLGYLRTAVRTATGRLDYRCPAEPVAAFVAKGGSEADTVGRRCLCNGLVSTVGFAQVRDGRDEPPLLTSGDDLVALGSFLGDRTSYTAADVIDYLLSASSYSAATTRPRQ